MIQKGQGPRAKGQRSVHHEIEWTVVHYRTERSNFSLGSGSVIEIQH